MSATKWHGLVDVVTVTYGNANEIAATVNDLRCRPEVASVTVVDHGHDGSGRVAREAGAVVFADPTNPGFGAGMNRAAACGSAPFLLLMNPDAQLHEDALPFGLTALGRNEHAAAVQGLIDTPSTGSYERAGGRELGPLDLLGRSVGAKRLLRSAAVRAVTRRIPALAHQVDRGAEAVGAVETLAATAPLVRRDAFASVNGFDERYFLYGEDLDLCRRLRRCDWELLYLPVPWARHENGSSSSGWVARELRWWEGTMAFAARWWDAWAFAAAEAAAAIMACRLVLADRSCWREIVDALVVAPARIRRREGQARLVR